MTNAEVDHTKVAPTAWGVAYLRTLSDVPFATEMFDALEADLAETGQPSPAWNGDRDYLAPQLEARYKLIDKLIKAAGNRQILELAAGIATHGMALGLEDPDLKYVELDLPAVADKKRMLLTGLGVSLPAGLTVVDGDALIQDDIWNATQAFDRSKPVTVMNEGLLRYLDFDQKAQVARNIRGVLEVFGGVWITPDSNLRAAMLREDEKATDHTARVARSTGIDIAANAFESQEASVKFYEDLGFDVEVRSFLEVSDELVSPEKVGMSPDDVRHLNEPIVAYLMRLKE